VHWRMHWPISIGVMRWHDRLMLYGSKAELAGKVVPHLVGLWTLLSRA
jgi:hypothetical protein